MAFKPMDEGVFLLKVCWMEPRQGKHRLQALQRKRRVPVCD